MTTARIAAGIFLFYVFPFVLIVAMLVDRRAPSGSRRKRAVAWYFKWIAWHLRRRVSA
jgi:hypothetical protein